MGTVRALALFLLGMVAGTAGAQTSCGRLVVLKTHCDSTMRYALSQPRDTKGEAVALVLLPGGDGHADLDDKGCPRALTGNSLIRSIPLFNELGFATALVDAEATLEG